jgi:CHAT domain-containing protein
LKRRGPRFVAFANPRYALPLAEDCPESAGPPGDSPAAGSVRARHLEPLRGASREVQAVAARYGADARVYEGAQATEERVASDPDVRGAERLHFAVHGIVCQPRPEQSGLVLALDDDAAEDGVLTMPEIFRLDLNADLVVLSACESGTGKLVWGEGVFGLARAFFYAGASSLVVSLWQVSDRSTADLMTAFYERLDAGDDKAEALRRAKLRLIDEGGAFAAPFHWAPFVLLGRRGSDPPSSVGVE